MPAPRRATATFSLIVTIALGAALLPFVAPAAATAPDPDLVGGSPVTGVSGVPTPITDLQVTATGSPTVPVHLHVTNGSLAMTTTTGLSFTGGSTGATLDFSGSLANVNAALATLQYTRSGIGTDTLEASLVAPGEVFYPGTGNLYEFVSGAISWNTAKPAAEARTKYGAPGYLATITSSGENAFITARLGGAGWMGASDSAIEGDWKWVTGPETGTSFYSASTGAVGGAYNNWNTGEPNDSGGNEDCGQFLAGGTGKWNDLPCNASIAGYVVEYGTPGSPPNVASKDVSIATAAVPSTMAAPTATAGAASASVAFIAPAANGSAITGYTVTSAPDGLTGTGTSSPITVSGLTNGTSYTFTIVATNGAGDSVASPASNAVIPIDVPATMVAPTATAGAPGTGSASVAFTAPADNGSTITGYTVTSAPDGFIGTGTTSPITVTGLTIGTAYTFTIVATNTPGDSLPSPASNAVTPIDVPATMAAPTATAGATSASVAFTPPGDNGSAITGYTVTSAPGGFIGTGTTSPITVTGLTNGTHYTFTIVATNDAGDSLASPPSNEVIPIAVPGVPGQPTAVAGDTQVTVTVVAPSTGGAPTSYLVTASPGGATCTVTGASGSCTVTGLTNGTAYTFKSTATNGSGTSSDSAASDPVTPFHPVAPAWTDQTLGVLQVGEPFTDGVVASGAPPPSYSVSAGTLPAGLTLDATTGAITGSPTAAGDFDFTITADNGVGSAVTKQFTGTVAVAASINLTLELEIGTQVGADNNTVLVAGAGLLPGSDYTVVMHSEPRQIASGTIGTDGTFSQRILLPADTAAGEAHSISVNGTGLNGAAISDTAWFSVGFDGAIEAVSDTGPVADPVAPVADPVASATLPLTGTNAMTLLFWALAWLMAGSLFVGESKRRRHTVTG